MCCSLKAGISARGGFLGCCCWQGEDEVREAECASELIDCQESGGGSHTSLQAEGTLLQSTQALAVWFLQLRDLWKWVE